MNRYFVAAAMLLLYMLPAKAQVTGGAVDVQHYDFDISLTDANNIINGKAVLNVLLLKNTTEISLDLIKKGAAGKGMLVSSVTEKGKALKFDQQDQSLKIYTNAKAKTHHSYTITYSGIPADGLIIATNKYGDRTFFGDNWLKRARNWLPTVDDVADKATVNFTVTAPSHYKVVANGRQISREDKGALAVTKYSETAPISTKIMVIGVAKFAVSKPVLVNDSIAVTAWTYPQDSVAGFKSYGYAAEILPVFIKKLGPFVYKKLANVQSKTIFGGMENAGAIFYYENSVTSKDIEALVAHEIGHQWFGDAVTEKSAKDVWLSEGFATFMADYYHEHKYGADSLKKRLLADKKKIYSFEAERQTPVIDSTPETDPLRILNANSYEKGNWVLHMLRRKLGDTTFWQGIRRYYGQYKNSNANTDDFRTVMEKVSGTDLKPFFKQWLYTPLHPRLKVTLDTKTEKGKIVMKIEQLQDVLYDMDLEYMVNDKRDTIHLKDKITTTKLQLPITNLQFDPDINSLAEVIMEKQVW